MGLPYEDADDRAAHVETFGEEFDTGHPTMLVAEYFRDFYEAVVGEQIVEMKQVRIRCLSTEVQERSLVRESPIRYVDEDIQYYVQRFEPDKPGLTYIVLKR